MDKNCSDGFFMTFFPSLFILIFSILNKCCPEAMAQILYSTCDPDVGARSVRGLFFIHSFSTYVCVDNKRENLAYTSLQSFICVLAVFFVVIMTVLLIPRMRHGAFGPPHEVQLAAHRLEKSVVIRLVEKLHSADNPTEIAHGFPVPEVENKHTPLEYIMRVPNKSQS